MDQNWIRAMILDELQGTGLRPEVISQVDEDQEREYVTVTITLPLEWKVVSRFAVSPTLLDKVLDFTEAVKTFTREAWPDKIMSDLHYDMFRKIPGSFEFISEDTPEIAYHIVMARVVDAIGKRNVKGIDMYEDMLLVKTRHGNWSIGYDNLRDRLDEAITQMRGWMRRPLRYAYLRKIRNKKDDKGKV